MNHLVVLWTSGDQEVAQKMVFMYTTNAQKYQWWDEIRLVIWGASARLLSENSDLQEQIKAMITSGVIVEACKACADSYGVSDLFKSLGITVRYLGKPLSEWLQSDMKVLSI